MRICKQCKCRVLRTTGELAKKYPYYCPSCYNTLCYFETEKVSLHLKDVCAGDGYIGVKKTDGYRYMTVVFNDRAYEDHWTEPYIVHLRLCTDKSAKDVATELIGISKELYDENRMDASSMGIEEIMECYREVHPELEYFIFGCPTVPYGDNIESYGL